MTAALNGAPPPKNGAMAAPQLAPMNAIVPIDVREGLEIVHAGRTSFAQAMTCSR